MDKKTKKSVSDLGKPCNDLSECDDACDLDPSKICDNCGKCLGLDDSDFREIEIEGILDDDMEIDDYIIEDREVEKLHKLDSQLKKDAAGDYVFIDDIPELKEKYDKQIQDILEGKE